MIIFNSLPFYIILLLIDAVSASGLVSSVVQSIHKTAQSHTKRMARDLRVAFGAVILSQNDVITDGTPQRVVYCKSASGALSPDSNGLGSSSANNGTAAPSGSGSSNTTTPPAGSGSSAPSSTPSSSGSSQSPFQLVDSHSGSNFFNGWTFFQGGDPTNGIVTYVDQNTASSNGLLEVNSNGNAVMRVETTPSVSNTRMSIRITSNKTYNSGLFILDAVHMPTGCGTWPAWWTNGPNWPVSGEIDIVEGVSDYTNNQATIHTNPGCTLPSSSSSSLGITGSVVGGTDCAAAQTGNQGCGVRSASDVSFGAAFNQNGGGVYAMLWTSAGISVYFFPRNSIPNDITNGAPQPSGWGLPMASWPSTDCNTSEFFYDHSVIFDTTLCGDWAGGVWGSAGIPGQEQSCAQRTGSSTCEAFVRANGAAFQEAYWEVQSVKIYQEN